MERVPTVWLARHGETEWNAKGWIQGHSDVPLSPVGRAQAERLAARLRDDAPGRIVSSDLVRAAETAGIVARAVGLPVETDAALREQCLGAWEGLHFREVAERWPEDARRYVEREAGHRPPGGESREEMRQRVVAALARHAPASGEPPVLLVAHGGVLQSLVYAILGLPPLAPRRFLLPNCGLTVLERREGIWFVSRLNDTAHLDGAGTPFPFA